MKQIFIFILFSMNLIANAQISTGGMPISFEYNKHQKPIAKLYQIATLKQPQLNKIKTEDEAFEKNGQAYRIGVNVNTDLNIYEHGTWTNLENGDRIWRLGIKIEEALALGIYFEDKLVIPEGGKLYAYNALHSQFIGAYTAETDNFTAMEMVQGDEITLEYYTPANQTMLPNIKIKSIAYFYRGVGDRIKLFESGRPIDEDRADACQVDVACAEISGWEPQRDAVVKYTFVLGQGTFLCSGALINNTAQDCTPYILSANHCGEPTNSSDITNHVWYFNYQRNVCSVGNTTPYNGAQSQTMSGGFFRASSELGTHPAANNNQVAGSDFTLLELSSAIPDSYNPFYAGWTKTTSASASGVGIHHPSGDEKKISTYSTSLTSTTYNGGWSGAHWLVYWQATANGHGVTEGGSSGSPIFNTNGLVVGHLSGGSSYCNAPNLPDLYGKFNKAWNQDGSSANAQLKPWLDPINSGVQDLAGSYTPCSAVGGQYCDATSTLCDEYISNVTLGGVSNSTTCNYYEAYWQNNPFQMSVGSSYYLQISSGIVGDTTIGYVGDQIAAWIDWNADGDFTDIGEQVYSHTIGATSTIPLQTIITVPAFAAESEIRMRVRITFDVATDGLISPCGISNYGEVEDYYLEVNHSALSILDNVQSSISIYPNPTNGSISIDLNSIPENIELLSITDVYGREVIRTNISDKTMSYDFSNYAKGLYILTVKGESATYSTKVIVN
ncbi:MAG: GEVED domain-containing protein [Putridiphycobacter sp.]|nr:GEVED domain-containing protein [Putridiphycobacter sp.]